MDSEELFLRQDAAFLETPEGVLLRGGGEDFFLKGKSAYRWLTALAPALSVGCTAERLCAGLDADRAAAVRRLLAQLVRSGFVRVRRVEPEGVLDAATRSRFAEQISFLAHHTDTPQAAFRKVREARVLAVGEGPAAASAVRLLLRNGVRRVALCGSVDDAPEGLEPFPGHDDAAVLGRAASWRPDALLVLPEGPSAGLVAALADHAAQRELLFLAGHARADRLLLGPLVRHGGTSDSCWHCLQLRIALTETTETSAARGEPPIELFPAVSAAAGSELAAELFKSLSGCIESELVNGVVLRDPLSLESTREPLVAHPSCPHCSHEEPLGECADRILEWSSGGHDLPRDGEKRAAAQTAALAPPRGPLADYVVRTVGSGDTAAPNENADNNNTAAPSPATTGLTSTPVTMAYEYSGGELSGGNGPTGDDVAGLAGELIADGFTTFTVDLALMPAPLIDIEKHTNGVDADTPTGPFIVPGDPVTWTYIVTNTGGVDLTSVTVTDDLVAAAEIDCDGTGSNVIAGPLAPGASFTCTATGTATAGQYANIGTVTGLDPTQVMVTDTDPSHYLGALPAIDIEKATNGQDADNPPGVALTIGDVVEWTYVVTNTGNVPLINVTVTDDKVAASEIWCNGTASNVVAGPLAPGGSFTCTAFGVAVAGQYANTGTVTGTVPGLQIVVTDTDPSHYFASPPPPTGNLPATGGPAPYAGLIVSGVLLLLGAVLAVTTRRRRA